MTSTRRSLTGPVLAGIGLLGATLANTPSDATSALLPGTVGFTEVGAVEWVVPTDVCEVLVTAVGAQGGAGGTTDPDGDGPRLAGGQGAVATARIGVEPGETLEVRVGGAGGDGIWDGSPTEGGVGGFNGGGDGGTGGPTGGGGGGGGGGASDVRQGGDGLADRVVVAGGGGGGGAYTRPDTPTFGAGGAAGDPGDDGGPGMPGSDDGDEAAIGGAGATATAAGTGGAGGHFATEEFPGDMLAIPGADGASGLGGNGGTTQDPDDPPRAGGGGGGGGLFGGGGGGAAAWENGAGGGGGSSLADDVQPGGAPATIGDVVAADGHHGDGLVMISPIGDCPPVPSTTEPDPTIPGTTAPDTTDPGVDPARPATGGDGPGTSGQGGPHSTGTASPARAVSSTPTYTG